MPAKRHLNAMRTSNKCWHSQAACACSRACTKPLRGSPGQNGLLTACPNVTYTKKELFEWAHRDSNSGLQPYESCALTNCAMNPLEGQGPQNAYPMLCRLCWQERRLPLLLCGPHSLVRSPRKPHGLQARDEHTRVWARRDFTRRSNRRLQPLEEVTELDIRSKGRNIKNKRSV